MINGGDYASIDENKPPEIDKTGMRFAYVRASGTDRGHPFIDATCARDRDAWKRSGRMFGGYMILGWKANGASPEVQAQTFIKAYGPRREGELPPALDLEADNAKALGRTESECLEWAHRAYDMLLAYYGVVLIYTSERVWIDVFGNLPTRMGASPLWVKIAYPYKAKQPPHPEACPLGHEVAKHLPLPWRAPSSAGAWIVQYQGDARPVPGFTSTVDLNAWLTYAQGTGDARDPWVKTQLGLRSCSDVQTLQRARGLGVDGLVGPVTFAALA